jgi:stress-induced morphogen
MTQDQAAQLVTAFKARFGGEVEPHPDDNGQSGRFDFSIVSPGFRGMTTLQRQDAVWETVNQVLGREASLDVGMVWAFAPGEIDEWIEGLST